MVATTTSSVITFFAQFPLEILFVGALWFVLAVYAFSAGTSRLNSLGIALAFAGLLFSLVPVTWPLSDGTTQAASPWAYSVIVLGALVVIAYVIARRMSQGESFGDTGSIVTGVLAAVAVVAIFLALWSHIPVLTSLHAFPALLAPYFGAHFFFWWLFGPLLILAGLSQTRFW